jgi:RNA polymerase sigma-70 factor (ECF subfamily)
MRAVTDNDRADAHQGARVTGTDDGLLVARARDGSTEAFEELVRRYRNQVYALCHHFVHSREDAWDLAQETFVNAHRALPAFRGESGFKTWLMRIAANRCKDHLKKRRLDTVPFDDAQSADGPAQSPQPDEEMEHRELARAIEAAVKSLPMRHRTAFLLREYEGLSYQEMAEVMNCNIGTVMSRLFHARRKLQAALRGTGLLEDRQHV